MRIINMIGFTLVEVLLSCMLGLLLISLLANSYVIAEKHEALRQKLQYIQLNAETALQLLSHDVRMAGYLGCPFLTNDFPILPYGQITFTPQNKLQGQNNPNAFLSVRYLEFPHSTLLRQSSYSEMIVSTPPYYKAGDILLMTNCDQAEIFQVRTVIQRDKRMYLLSTTPLRNYYQEHSELGRLLVHTYYAADTHRQGRDGRPIYALYRANAPQHSMELVEGIDHISVHFIE